MNIAICDQCSREFKPRNKLHKRCSPECKTNYNRTYAKDYYAEGSHKQPSGEYKMFHNAKNRCSKSGLPFELAIEDIKIPDDNICPILGVEMIKGGRYAPSLDRKDSTKGYTPDNIWVISRLANNMKHNSTLEEQRKFAEWVNQLRH